MIETAFPLNMESKFSQITLAPRPAIASFRQPIIAIRAADCNRMVGLLREFRNLHVVRLQQASGSVINRRNGDLIRDLGLQKA